MEHTAKRLQGLFVPHVTPFDNSGAVDFGSLERLMAHPVSRRGVCRELR
jgi:dihydrodipicolinate synthase/N-acetylneuraminate lyase